MKSGDHLVCDLTAQDLWLNVKIEADKIGLVIFFEIKVYRNSLISGLKQSLVDIANQLFASRMNTVTYVEDECEVMKIDLNCKEHILTTDTKPMLDQSTETSERTEKLDNKILIGDVFDFLDRYLLLRLEKKVEDLREKSITMPSCTVSDSLIQISSTMPIRNLRVEPQVLNRNRNPQQTTNSDNTEQKNCHCYLL